MGKFNLPRLRRYMEQGSIAGINTGASALFPSGSTKFGDTPDDTHQFTGSIFAGEVSGTNATFNSITGSLFGTASYALVAEYALNSPQANTSSLLTDANISNDTITFTKGDGSTFDLTVDNVVNAQTASFLNGFDQNNYLTTASFDSFILSYNTGSFSGSFVGTVDGTASFASNTDLLDGRDSTTFANTGSNTFTGIQILQQDLTGTYAYFSGDVFINGTASISNLETRNQQSLVVGDKYIVILSGGVDHVGLDGAGILFGSGGSGPTVDENGANAYLRYRNFYDAVEAYPNFRVSGSAIISNNLTVTGSLTLSTVSGTTAQFTSVTASFSGNGSNITNITASNISNFTNDVRAQISAGQNIGITNGQIAFTGTLPVANGGTGLTSAGASANILISNGTGFASETLSQDVTITSAGVATTKGLYTNPLRNPAVTAPVSGDYLKWGGTDWFPAPVAATVAIGSLQLTADPAQTITANGQTILPTSAYWRLNTSGNYNAGTINYVGASTGQILIIQVPLGQTGAITFTKGGNLALASNTRKVNAGGSLQLIYDGTTWTEMFFNTSTST